MHLNLRILGMTKGIRLRILLAAMVGLMAVGAGTARRAISGVVIAQVFQLSGRAGRAILRKMWLKAIKRRAEKDC